MTPCARPTCPPNIYFRAGFPEFPLIRESKAIASPSTSAARSSHTLEPRTKLPAASAAYFSGRRWPSSSEESPIWLADEPRMIHTPDETFQPIESRRARSPSALYAFWGAAPQVLMDGRSSLSTNCQYAGRFSRPIGRPCEGLWIRVSLICELLWWIAPYV